MCIYIYIYIYEYDEKKENYIFSKFMEFRIISILMNALIYNLKPIRVAHYKNQESSHMIAKL